MSPSFGPSRARFPDGRWHWQHGPIDLVIGAEGDASAIDAAHASAWRRFERVLAELVAELPLLKQPVAATTALHGDVARRMASACQPFRADFITPMAAVAGAVADELIAHYRRDGIERAWINNGGDIALHLAPGRSTRVGLVADLACVAIDGRFDVTHDMPVRGIATSGWRGRSFSLGIADSVTVLARTAAEADAAATIVANAVNLIDDRIVRRPASDMKDDSDLGDRLVTVDVPRLGDAAVQRALQSGLRCAERWIAEGRIEACALVCQGRALTTTARDRRLAA